MNKINDLIYLNHSTEYKQTTLSGIEFKEFISNLQLNLILLRHQYSKALHHKTSGLDYIVCEEISNLVKENVYIYGDFCWVDFSEKEDLDNVTPQEKDELLYMAHQFKPLLTPFFSSIKNNFVYLSHDDGWLTKFYCNYNDDLFKILSNLIKNKMTSLNIKIKPIPNSFLESSFYELLKQGVIFDFAKVVRISDSIKIPLYVVGEISDMDTISKALTTRIKNKNKLLLTYANKEWKID